MNFEPGNTPGLLNCLEGWDLE